MRSRKINPKQFKFKDSFSELTVYDFELLWKYITMHDKKVKRLKQIAELAEANQFDDIEQNEAEQIGIDLTRIKASILQVLCTEPKRFVDYIVNVLRHQDDFHQQIENLLNKGYQIKSKRNKKRSKIDDGYRFSLLNQFADPNGYIKGVQGVQSFTLTIPPETKETSANRRKKTKKVTFGAFNMDAQCVNRVKQVKAMLLSGDWSQLRRLVAMIVRPSNQTKEVSFSKQNDGVLNVQNDGASILFILNEWDEKNTKQIELQMEQFKMLPFDTAIGLVNQIESFFFDLTQKYANFFNGEGAMVTEEQEFEGAFGMDISIDYLRENSHYSTEVIGMMDYSYFLHQLAFFSSKAEARTARAKYEREKAEAQSVGKK